MAKQLANSARSPKVSGIAGHAIHGSPAVILVVEDTEELRSCVAEYFRVVGFDVVAAENAGDALAAIDSGIHVDLVFTDINMPGAIDGMGLARWLSAHRPLLPIILTSGDPRPELEGSAPHYHFVRKPYSLDELEHDIRQMVS
ncbi:MAG TPA: response regulator [Steroidobacteraceae bacterium]